MDSRTLLERVEGAFSGWEVTPAGDGAFVVKLPDGDTFSLSSSMGAWRARHDDWFADEEELSDLAREVRRLYAEEIP